MSMMMWLAAIPLAIFLWWVGFIATSQLRHDKNAERAEKAKKLGIDLTPKDT